MTTSMLQDTIQTSPPNTGTRFRLYASPNHHVTRNRYITSNDPRGYIPVYEYPLNGQWIMMDIDDGYILWTGIWKALGNSKADIVKMIDSQPDLAPLIRRVRGGYLKIQGTWMPYEVALRLSRRVAYTIRDDLIPLFGPTFPSTCLSPDQPGYGQVVASGPNRRRARRSTHATASLMHTPRDAHANWTVVTPHDPSASRSPASPTQSPQQYTPMGYHPNRDLQVHFHHSYQSSVADRRNGQGHGHSPDSSSTPSITSRDRAGSVRYSPYMTHAPHPSQRPPSASKSPLLLDIPSLSLRSPNQQAALPASTAGLERITLPPILGLSDQSKPRSSYALPPISAMEDLRGLHMNDSAAVLQRLKSDEQPTERGHQIDAQIHNQKRPLSFQPYISPDSAAGLRFQSSHASRSYSDHSYRARTPSDKPSDSDEDFRDSHSSGLSLSVPSDISHDGFSTCDPSPISPTTPRSAVSAKDHHSGVVPRSTVKDRRRVSDSYHTLSVPSMEWAGGQRHEEIRDSDKPFAPRRYSDTDTEAHPHRPW